MLHRQLARPYHAGMRLASLLLRLSSVVFAVTGLAYLFVPGLALSVVGIPSAQTSDFLLRTEGVALLCGAGVLWAASDARPTGMRLALVSLAVYYVLGVIYFAIAGRHRLVLSPEEEFALTKGERGVPDQEGYTSSKAEQESILGGGDDGSTTSS